MCTALFYCSDKYQIDKYALILVFFRDEFLNRPTSSASFRNGLLQGCDDTVGKEGGTWLAINKEGSLAFLTNIFGTSSPTSVSRGFVVSDVLRQDNYLNEIYHNNVIYNPFNLCYLKPYYDEDSKLLYNSYYLCRTDNHPSLSSQEPCQLDNGVHSISNSPYKTPYRKAVEGKKVLEDIVTRLNNTSRREDLLKGLRDIGKNYKCFPDDPQLKLQCPDIEVIKSNIDKFSKVIVDIPDMNYGTRTRTIVLVDHDGNVYFEETIINSTKEEDIISNNEQLPVIFEYQI